MPVAVPIHERSSAHLVIEPHSNFQGVVPSLAPKTSKHVIQSSGQLTAPQPELSYRSHLRGVPPSWPPFIPFCSEDVVSRPGLTREGSGLGHGLITAISKQVHAEACHSPGLPIASHPTMGLQHFGEWRSEQCIGKDWKRCELGPVGPPPRMDGQKSAQNGGYNRDTFASMKSYQCLDSGIGEELCDSLLHPAATPFADFVDRIVATEVSCGSDGPTGNPPVAFIPVDTPGRQAQAVPTEPLSNPAYIRSYRAVVEPISEWMADYVWKVCTDGINLPRRFVGLRSSRSYEEKPSSSLAKSIHSILCSTLLQPSAIILALWYITRLPILFEGQAIGVNLTPSELEFRKELYGEGRFLSALEERSEMEACAPFRIALLGCMLANKWLDDHTFSNKTWQSISDVPIQSINRLELAALAVLGHDLSVTPKAWEMWLAQLHRFPGPVCRPSVNDSHANARKMITDLAQLQGRSDLESSSTHPMQPVFSALLVFDVQIRSEPCQTASFDPFEIDLDEDGPLREEYVPKRRPSLLKPDSHRRSYSFWGSEWSISADHLGCDARCLGADALAKAPGLGNISAGCILPFAPSQMTSWNVRDGFDYDAAAFLPHQTGTGSSQSKCGFGLSSYIYPAPAMCPPTYHSRASTDCSGSSTQSSGHMRSYSQTLCTGNDACWLPSCSRYVGHPSTFIPSHSDASHFRPLWLKA